MKKVVIGIIIGAIIFGSIGVYATAKYMSKDISYTKKDGTITSVDEALNDLYTEINDDLINRINGTVTKTYYVGDRVAGKDLSINLPKGKYYLFTSDTIGYVSTTVYDSTYYNDDLNRLSSSNFKCSVADGMTSVKTSSEKYGNIVYGGHTAYNQIYLCESTTDGTITYISSTELSYNINTQNILLMALKISE